MKHDRKIEYRRTEVEAHAFLRRSDEIFSDNQPADVAIDDEAVASSRQAEIESILADMGDDDAPAPAEAPAVAAPQPSPGNAPVEPDAQIDDLLADLVLAPADTLTDDALIADTEIDDTLTDDDIAELDERDERMEAAYAPPSKADGPKATTREGLERLHKQMDMLRASVERSDAAQARREEPFEKAKKRRREAKAKKTADARRARDAVRRRTKRAAEITPKRIAALDDAIANQGGKFYVKLAILGAQEYAQFREARTEARRVHGDDASMEQIAATWSALAGVKKTKSMVQNRSEAVAKLEAKGGPWYPWREF